MIVNEKRRAAFPEQPWKWDKEWANGRLTDTAKGVWGAFFLTLLPLAFVWGMAIWAYQVKGPEPGLIAVLIPFFLVSGAIPVLVLRARWAYSKYGDSLLEMDTVPGLLGETFSGTLETGAFLFPAEGLKVTVTCTRLRRTRNGSNRTLWQHSYYVMENDCTVRNRRQTVPISFQLPRSDAVKDQSLETNFSLEPQEHRVVWNLRIDAKTHGVDFTAHFEIPVFQVENPDVILRKKPGQTAPNATPQTQKAALKPACTKIEISPLQDFRMPNGIRVDIPLARWVYWWSILLPFSFLVCGWLLMSSGDWMSTQAVASMWGIGITTFFTLMHLLTLYFFQTRRIRIMPDSISVGYGPFCLRTVSIPCENDENIRLHQEISGNLVYYNLLICSQDTGKERTVVHHLRDQTEAEWLKNQIKTACRECNA